MMTARMHVDGGSELWHFPIDPPHPMDVFDVLTSWPVLAVTGVCGVLAAGVYAFLALLRFLYDSIPPLEPSSNLADAEACALFRHLPFLARRLAWTPLGVFPTPVHTATIDKSSLFYIKREDLSSPMYGGNKVRTLQHTLASCVERKLSHPAASIFSVGSAGSNMNVASVVHGQALGLPVQPCSLSRDAPDFDNTLNLLSILSFDPAHLHVWTRRWAFVKAVFRAFIRPSQGLQGSMIMPPGGNNLLGVLGQMGGLLELAEQIEAGDVPDVDVLYVPVGSSCTLTGLVLGVCLARHLNLAAFRSRSFQIVAVPVHPGIAKLQRWTGLYKSSPHVPLFPRYGFRRVAAYLMQQGLDVDLEPLAVDFLAHHVHLVTDTTLIGEYGTHSVASLAAATQMDARVQVEGSAPLWSDPSAVAGDFKPWLCGHFAAKPFAKLMQDLHVERAEINAASSPEKPKVRLFWLTKSYTQPRGDADEWTKFAALAQDKTVKEWAEEGRAYSLLRPGHVNLAHGSAKDYRHVMTFVGNSKNN